MFDALLAQTSLTEAQIREWTALLVEYSVKYGLTILYAVAIWLIGTAIARRASRAIRESAMRTGRIDEAVAGFLESIVRWLFLAIVIIAILQLFGISSSSLVAVLGAATLAVGLALQGTLSNFAAGVMLVVFKPFRIGDFVEVGGHGGSVRKIDLFTTELATTDNVQIIIPNSEVWSSSIKNYSAHDRRRVDLTIGIDYSADTDKALSLVRQIIDADSRASGDPEPFVKVTNLGDSSVDVTVRVWCQAADYWDLKFDLTRRVKDAFDKAGISIPYPHIELVQKAPSPSEAAAS